MAIQLPITGACNVYTDLNDQEFSIEEWLTPDMFSEQPSWSTDQAISANDTTQSPFEEMPMAIESESQQNIPDVSSKHVPKFKFSQEGIAIMEKRYGTSKTPGKADIKELARLVQATPNQVRKWFCNRRNREPQRRNRAPGSMSLTARSNIGFNTGEHISSIRQASASRSHSTTTLSVTTPGCSSSSVGMKRKCQSTLPWPNKKHQPDEEHVTQTDNNSLGKIFQCTVCCKEFSTQQSWRRHEQTVCYSRRVWTCLAHGWYSCEGKEPVSSSNSCVFCELVDPPHNHAIVCKHRVGECLARPVESRQFKRKDGLRSHCKEFHHLSPSTSLIDSWETRVSTREDRKDWECGFCGSLTTNWPNHIEHVARHFERGLDMYSWLAAGQVQLRSLLIGGWSSEPPMPQDLKLTYIENLGVIAYTINWGVRKVAIRFSVGDIAHVRRDTDKFKPWKRENEEAYIIELNVAPQFFFLTSDEQKWQWCKDFTENCQASTYFVHTLVGLRHSQFSDLMKKIDEHRREPVQDLPLDDSMLRAPMVVCSGPFSRYCPLCYQFPDRACDTLAHSIYTACSACGKRVHREHACTDSGDVTLGSMFVCRGRLRNGTPWGCGTKFETYITLWLHLTSDAAGATCRRPFVEEQEQDKEGEDLARMYDAGLRLGGAETADSDLASRSGPSVVYTI